MISDSQVRGVKGTPCFGNARFVENLWNFSWFYVFVIVTYFCMSYFFTYHDVCHV